MYKYTYGTRKKKKMERWRYLLPPQFQIVDYESNEYEPKIEILEWKEEKQQQQNCIVIILVCDK